MRVATIVLLALSIAGCATTRAAAVPALHRGASAQEILTEVQRVLQTEGYKCTPAPDRSRVSCLHAELTDVNVNYLPGVNMVQAYVAFTRSTDESLAEQWRGACSATLEEANRLNAEYLAKVTCEDDMLFFAFYSWVPDRGFTDEDVLGFFDVVRRGVREAIIQGKMLKPE